MFGHRYYPRGYFPPEYFGDGGAGIPGRGGWFGHRYFGAGMFGPRYFSPRNPVIHGGYFGHHFFAIPFFGPHYFSPFGRTHLLVPPPVVVVQPGGGSFRQLVRFTVEDAMRLRLRNDDELLLFIVSAAIACGLLD